MFLAATVARAGTLCGLVAGCRPPAPPPAGVHGLGIDWTPVSDQPVLVADACGSFLLVAYGQAAGDPGTSAGKIGVWRSRP